MMMSPTIRSRLSDFVRRSRRVTLLRAIGLGLAGAAAWVLLWCGIDRYFQLPQLVRAGALVMGIAAGAVLAIRTALVLRRKPDWVSVAAQIEDRDPRFAQKLITVTSQAISRPELRGSNQILARLEFEAADELQRQRPRVSEAARRGAWTAWMAAAMAGGILVSLLCTPQTHFTHLARRLIAPLKDLPPVTTTQIAVVPGNLDVVQSQPLTIDANVVRLGDSGVTLLLSDDDRGDWSRLTMTPTGNGNFRFALASVDRDVRYYVTGGDARTPIYTIRVLRRPGVARFNVRYDYPDYTRLPPAFVSNDNGRVEAPVGTRAVVSIVSTEPLAGATISVDGQKQSMRPTSDPTSWQAELDVRSNQTYQIELLSQRHVAGNGPGEALIRALPDLPPQARLARGGDSLRLSPHAIVPVSYEALDDYGIQSLAMSVQVNGQNQPSTAIRLWGDPRRQLDTMNFDLAPLGLRVGDVVTLTLEATDTGGHPARSQPLQVLVSPSSVDPDTYQRIVELRHAWQLAQELSDQLAEAVDAEDRVAAGKGARPADLAATGGRRDRALITASQTAALLRQSLLRCITHSADQLPVALAGWIDIAEQESAAAQETFRQSGTAGGIELSQRQHLSDVLRRARQLSSELEQAARGEQAFAIIEDRQNLAAAEQRRPSANEKSRDRLAQTIERMRRDTEVETSGLSLNPAAPDIGARLGELVAAEKTLLARAVPVDFATAAGQWEQNMRSNPQQRVGLEARLWAAAQAEAVRAEGDLVRARDLDLASRAVAAVNSATRAAAKADPAPLQLVARDIERLTKPQRSRTGLKAPSAEKPADQLARTELARLTGELEPPDRTRPAAPGDSTRDAEGLAMQANAAAAQRQYGETSKLESALITRLRSRMRRGAGGRTQPVTAESDAVVVDRLEHHRQEAQRQMAAAQKVDELDLRQQQISTGGTTAEQQRNLADQITDVRQAVDPSAAEANSRDHATAEILGAQEQLAALPQTLADVIALASARHDAVARAGEELRRAAKAAVPDRPAAGRAAGEAERLATEATDRLARAAKPLAAPPIAATAQRLGAFSPEADAARDALLVGVVPALQSVEDALAVDDADQLDRAASDTREAIAYAQRELAAARDLLIKRDPLVAARWFARAAADSLAAQPPDPTAARRRQAGVSEWLSRAWDQSIHRAAHERLAIVPSLAAVLGPGQRNQSAQDESRFATARHWERLRDDGPELDLAADSDPPGYEQSLKLYFEALGKAQEAK
jgi:hypothetical protein